VPTPSRNARVFALLLWLGLVVVALVSPPARPDLVPWLKMTLAGYWIGQEALLVSVFSLVGFAGLVAAGVLGPDLRARPLPAWPFVLGVFAIGGYALLPWVVLSGDGGEGHAPLPRAIEGVGSRRWGVVLSLLSGAALGAGLWWGDPIGYLAIARAEGFAFVMSFDFVALWLITVVMVRRRSQGRAWLLALVPVLGPSLWMAAGRR
jgi:hypothetical protein